MTVKELREKLAELPDDAFVGCNDFKGDCIDAEDVEYDAERKEVFIG